MANINATYGGLRPYKSHSGPSTHRLTQYRIQTAGAAGTSSGLYQGNPCIPLTTGLIDVPGAAAGGTVPLLGIFYGCQYVDLTGKPRWSTYWPGTSSAKANTPAWAYVYDDPNQLFLATCDAAAADTIIFANANFATGITGSSTTGMGAAKLAVSTANTTDTLNMKIMGFDDQPGNDDATAAGRLAIVKLNVHHWRVIAGI